MCIAVFIWEGHPLYTFLLLLNRDEYHSRPTKALDWWVDGGECEVLGGRDEAAGGTWLGCNKQGKIAFITNIRQPNSHSVPAAAAPALRSRGHLPLLYLQGNLNPKEFASELVKEAHHYNAFNLILVDIPSKSMVYITNGLNSKSCLVTEVSPGLHVLSNASLDTPWPKAQRLSQSFKVFLDNCDEAEVLSAKDMAETLMTNSIKDDDPSMLPGILHPDWEYGASSVFVEMDTPLGRYGTRSTSVVSVNSSGEANFYERYLDKEEWKEATVSYRIEQIEAVRSSN